MTFISSLVLLFSNIFVLPSYADSAWSGQGEVSLEFRKFQDDGIDTTVDEGLSLYSKVESTYEIDQFKHVFSLHGRVDRRDSDRDLLVIDDGYFSMTFGEDLEFKATAGYKIFNWSATEGFHPADVVNSRNFDSNIEKLEKMGELTFELDYFFGDHSFQFFVWPRFEDPWFPGDRSRLGTGLDIGRPVLVDEGFTTQTPWVFQGGIRFSTTLGDADINVHFLHHIDRNMPLVGNSETQHLNIPSEGTFLTYASHVSEPLTPYYFMVNQLGGTYQLALDGFMFKVEGAYRSYPDETKIGVPIKNHQSSVLSKQIPVLEFQSLKSHYEIAMGIEYIWSHDDSGSETNLIFEGNGIFGVSEDVRVNMSVFQRDIMFAIQHAFNDTMSKEIFLSLFIDVERESEYLLNASYSQRLSDEWKTKFGVRVYNAQVKGETARGLERLHDDNHVFFNLIRYF